MRHIRAEIIAALNTHINTINIMFILFVLLFIFGVIRVIGCAKLKSLSVSTIGPTAGVVILSVVEGMSRGTNLKNMLTNEILSPFVASCFSVVIVRRVVVSLVVVDFLVVVCCEVVDVDLGRTGIPIKQILFEFPGDLLGSQTHCAPIQKQSLQPLIRDCGIIHVILLSSGISFQNFPKGH